MDGNREGQDPVKGGVAVLGGRGFLGRAVVSRLRSTGLEVRPLGREDTADARSRADGIPAFRGCDALLVTVGPARLGRSDPPSAIRRHLESLEVLLELAVVAGVRRCVLASSIKAETEAGCGPSSRRTPYGALKVEMERLVLELFGNREAVVLRLPPVHGPGGRGGVRQLLSAIDRGIPIPVAFSNRRSFLGLRNATSAFERGLTVEPGCYGPSDGEDVSSGELVCRIAELLGRRARAVAIPRMARRALARAPGIAGIFGALFEDAVCHDAPPLPGWRRPRSFEESLAVTVRDYVRSKRETREVSR